jgi:hypothetical protein
MKVKMDKQEFMDLVKQYSNDCVVLSFIKHDHPAYVKLLAAGQDIVPWLLERLRDSIGHDRGDYMDYDNCPWLTIALLGEITDGKCFDGFPDDDAGKLVKIRDFILAWGLKNKLIT